MKVEVGQIVSEELAEIIRRNVSPSEKMKALEGTKYTTEEYINRLLRGKQVITKQNIEVVRNLKIMAYVSAQNIGDQSEKDVKALMNDG